jgi:hypothetical protein
MTNQELNARAAEIMGFDGNHRNFGDMWYVPPEGSAWRAFLKKDWNPAENIAQAFELARRLIDQFPDYNFTICFGKVWNEAVIESPDGEISRVDGEKQTALAITRACVAAAGNNP